MGEMLLQKRGHPVASDMQRRSQALINHVLGRWEGHSPV